MLARSMKSLLSFFFCLTSISEVLGCPYVLLNSGSEVKQGHSFVTVDGIVTVQQFGGNFQIYTGEVGSLDCLLYETGVVDLPSNDATYRTKLQSDGNLITTRIAANTDTTSFAFASGRILLTASEKYLMITCDGNLEIVDSLIAGSETVIWSSGGSGCSLPSNNRTTTIQPSPPPSSQPSSSPSPQPSVQASAKPSSQPSAKPSLQPSTQPSAKPSVQSSSQPSLEPTLKPSPIPTNEPPACQRTVLLTQGQRIRSDTGPVQKGEVFVSQDSNGNFRIIRGTPQAPGQTLWQSCFNDGTNSGYYTALQTDSQFITRIAANDVFVWKRDSFSAQSAVGAWELALECNGGDFDSLVITDTGSATVAWRADLFTECVGVGSCPTAVELLSTNEQINNGDIKDVGNGLYSLEQQLNGNLRLWKGGANSLECVLWQTFTFALPAVQSYTIMQTDGNLVTYSQPSVDDPFFSVFESNTQTTVGSYYLMIDDCTFDNKAVAITRGNPINDPNSLLLGWAIFGDCTARRQRHLRGDAEGIQVVFANTTAVLKSENRTVSTKKRKRLDSNFLGHQL